ncbi:MAG: hypothetical protein KatS3mg051_1648 [Anaerolineae bacterium]|nr:MAG: hypothetical protein KatS3mg051_1648 [Anaerolineae bacterium]
MGQVEALPYPPDDVQIGQRGLDHDHVRAFLHVELCFAQGFAGIGRVHLMRAAVAESGGTLGGVAERAIETAGVLDRIGQDAHVLVPGAV